MSSPDKLLMIGRAARLMGVSVDTLRRLGRDGVIPEYRDSRRVRHYRRADVLRVRGSRLPRRRSGVPSVGDPDREAA